MNALRSIRLLLATPLLALASGPASGQLVYELSGQITDAQALTFAVLNGNLLSANPEPGDFPLAYTATLTAPFGTGATDVAFQFAGSFTSPTRSYTFDIELTGQPVDILVNNATQLEIVDALLLDDNTGLDLTLDKTTGTGSWSWIAEGAVPSSPSLDRSATATITAARLVIPEPTAAALAATALASLATRRGRRSSW